MSIVTDEVGVAVDFGMTGTAVAWNTSNNPKLIIPIIYWPDESYFRKSNKVPTRVSFDGLGRVLNWGFTCNENDPNTRELFKAFLDHRMFEPVQPEEKIFPIGPTEAANWSCLFLDSILKYVIDQIGTTLHKPRGGVSPGCRMLVHMTLTRPTTWDSASVAKFGAIARQAFLSASQASETSSYGAYLKRLEFDVTESEAAGSYYVHRNPSLFNHGDHFMVLDIGGATSDISILRVQALQGRLASIKVETTPAIQGISKGGCDITRKWQIQVRDHLREAGIEQPSTKAKEMAMVHRNELYRFSCDQTYPTAHKIPGYSRARSDPTANISHGQLMIANTGRIFDAALLDPIKFYIENLLKTLTYPPKNLLLCGGGANIPYILDQIGGLYPLVQIPNKSILAVAMGALQRWMDQIDDRTITMFDSDGNVVKVWQGTCGDINHIEHQWSERVTSTHVTARFVIEQPTNKRQRCQEWIITIESAALPIIQRSILAAHNPFLARTVEFVVRLKLPKISPDVSYEDFSTYTTDGSLVACTVESKALGYSSGF